MKKKLLLSIRDKILQLLLERTVTMLTIMFCLGVVIVLGNMSYFSQKLVETQALNNVQTISQALKKGRTLYNTEVVTRLKSTEKATVVHNYKDEEGAIPLPNTFLKEFGSQLYQDNPGLQVKSYSDFPFPWRKETGGPRDDFEWEALKFLQENPDRPFYRFETVGGETMLRYAEADVLKPECLYCHNNYPGTPKKDWKIGDVRGVLAINQSLDNATSRINISLKVTFILFGTLSAIGITGLGLSIRRLHKYSRKLERLAFTRQQAIEHAFSEIHNGPLQTLAVLLRGIQEDEVLSQQIFPKLKSLDSEIRGVGQYLMAKEREPNPIQDPNPNLKAEELIRLGDGTILKLDLPIHELFYDIFNHTLKRDFPHFKTIKVRVRDFEKIETSYLDLSMKRVLCTWLEEAICNIGKHAIGTTRIIAIGKQQQDSYILKVIDNGSGFTSNPENQGTKHCKKLVGSIQGVVKRESLPEKGTLYQVSFPLKQLF